MSLTLRYLAAAGWWLNNGQHALLIDPYFTRLPMWRYAFGRAVPDRDLIKRYTPPADHILVTHPHVDHILDVPQVAALTGAAVHASAQSCELLRALGVPAGQTDVIHAGDVLSLGPWQVKVYASAHRVILGRVPATGPLRKPLHPPLRARDYRIREQFTLRITHSETRVLIVSGIDDEPALTADVVAVGADASPTQLTAILSPATPHIVLPNHWDDMFRPLSRPTRPMLNPSVGPRQPLRLDMDRWAHRVAVIAPDARIIIPHPLDDIPL